MEETETVAKPQEVLSVLTSVLRLPEDGSPVPRLRAAELLGRHYGLFDPRGRQGSVNPQAVRALEEAVRELPRP